MVRRARPRRGARACAGGARARDVPLLARALARGELSYAKVRALTRVATPETEERLLKIGRAGTAAHVECIVRGWRKVDRIAEAREARRQHGGRALHVYQDEDGMVTVRGRLTPEVGVLLMQALDAARDTLYQQARLQCVDGSSDAPTMAQRQADALALLAETALHHLVSLSRRPGRAIPGGGPRRCPGSCGSRSTPPVRPRERRARFRGNVAPHACTAPLD